MGYGDRVEVDVTIDADGLAEDIMNALDMDEIANSVMEKLDVSDLVTTTVTSAMNEHREDEGHRDAVAVDVTDRVMERMTDMVDDRIEAALRNLMARFGDLDLDNITGG